MAASLSLNNLDTPSHYGFSATRIEDLKASEFTLVTIVLDVSGSVRAFQQGLIDCLKTILAACQHSQRKTNLVLRLVLVNHNVREAHGFRLLSDIKPDEYDTIIDHIGGNTALFDGTHTAIDATVAYGKTLTAQGITNNAVVYIITDGDDNASTFGANEIRTLIQKTEADESLESIQTVLIGVNANDSLSQFLSDFKEKAGLDQVILIKDSTPSSLARMGNFISRSISAVSLNLNNGKSANLSF
jgi:hypothetical protein